MKKKNITGLHYWVITYDSELYPYILLAMFRGTLLKFALTEREAYQEVMIQKRKASSKATRQLSKLHI